MKLVISIVFSTIFIFAESRIEPERIFLAALRCRRESGATKDDIHNVAVRDIPETETGKCMLKCMEENAGIMTNGRYSPDNTRKMLRSHHGNTKWVLRDIDIAVQNCEDLSNQLPEYTQGTCEHAWALAVCLDENLKAAQL